MNFQLETFNVKLYDEILNRGLSSGIGDRDGQMCIEAAICTVLGREHGDNPKCVAKSVRIFKITLNDSDWSSPKARARGLRDLGLAQLGSLGVVDDVEFTKRLAEKTIRILIPKIFRQVANGDKDMLKAADRCEKEGTKEAASVARSAASAAEAAAHYAASNAASYAASAAEYAAEYAARYVAFAAEAAEEAAYVARSAASAATNNSDEYLILSANLALEVLRELNSPGIALLS